MRMPRTNSPSDKPFDLLNIESARVLGLIAAVWLVCCCGIRLLSLPDEGRYVGVAWDMYASGQWLVPTLDGMPYFHKPPLFYWLTAATMSVFGASEWGVRLVPAGAAWLVVMAVYLFTKHYKNSQTATLAALILLTQPFFFLGAQFSNLDMLVASMIGCAIVCGAHAVLQADQSRSVWRYVLAMYVFTALAVLSKGLIGVVLPAAVLFIWLIIEQRFKAVLTLLWLPGIAAFFAIAAPWFVAMQYQFPGFYDYFFIYHHFQRFAATGFNNAQPFYFYPVVITVLALPSSLILLRLFKRSAWGRTVQPKGFGPLMWVWLLLVVVFFSIPSSKLIGYVMPALAPLACLMSLILLQWTESFKPHTVRICLLIALAVAMLLCVVANVVVALRPSDSVQPLTRQFAQQVQPTDPVYVLGHFPFDLPFYLQLKTPVRIVGNWTDPNIVKHDNWIKELYDARLFSAQPSASPLVETQAFEAQLCRTVRRAQGNVWVWAAADALPAQSLLRGIQASYQEPAINQPNPRSVWKLNAAQPQLIEKCHALK
jgi:4-amino-4-deoxy-L-arabinose transferase-like glycosyltransferase